MFYLTYKDNIEKNLIFSLVGLMIGINLAIFSVYQLFNYPFNELQFTIFQLLSGLVIYSVGIVSRNRGYLFPIIFKMFGYLVTFICVYLLAFKAILDVWIGGANNVYLFGSLILVGLITLFLADERRSDNFRHKSRRIELAALVAALLGGVILLVSPHTIFLNIIVMNSVLVIFALSSIFLGVELKRPPIFTLGILTFVLFIITRYIDVTWALKEKSLFFIVGGLVILFLGTFLEKQRRKVIERMKPE
jgi:1-acyl-sn-glycerol-3-phosphate acyltransferase